MSVPAAFGRLCVETKYTLLCRNGKHQPPSGGCVLKPIQRAVIARFRVQPPSGGCVLKLSHTRTPFVEASPAAFGRLCVETNKLFCALTLPCPAAFGRLCVETFSRQSPAHRRSQPPSGGCVLKHPKTGKRQTYPLPAAFGRLCVETMIEKRSWVYHKPAAFGRLCVETLKAL